MKDEVFIPGREGSLQLEMVAAARRHGMLVYPLQGGLESVLEEVAAGNPVLVLQNQAFSWWPRWHFAVVVGFDRERRELVLRSGITRRCRGYRLHQLRVDLEAFGALGGADPAG